MKTAYTTDQDIEYTTGMMKVWTKELQEIASKLSKLEATKSLEQIKLQRVIKEIVEAHSMLSKQR